MVVPYDAGVLKPKIPDDPSSGNGISITVSQNTSLINNYADVNGFYGIYIGSSSEGSSLENNHVISGLWFALEYSINLSKKLSNDISFELNQGRKYYLKI